MGLGSMAMTRKSVTSGGSAIPAGFENRHFLTLLDYSPAEIMKLIDFAAEFASDCCNRF